jgi:hypothetical protein
MEGKKAKNRYQVPQQILEVIEASIHDIQFGSITLIIQDAHIIQLEKNEKIRLDATSLVKLREAKKVDPGSHAIISEFRSKMTAALTELQYGQVTLLIKDGTIVQIDRTDKQRVSRLQGVFGEGI